MIPLFVNYIQQTHELGLALVRISKHFIIPFNDQLGNGLTRKPQGGVNSMWRTCIYLSLQIIPVLPEFCKVRLQFLPRVLSEYTAFIAISLDCNNYSRGWLRVLVIMEVQVGPYMLVCWNCGIWIRLFHQERGCFKLYVVAWFHGNDVITSIFGQFCCMYM